MRYVVPVQSATSIVDPDTSRRIYQRHGYIKQIKPAGRKSDQSTCSLAIEFAKLLEPHRSRVYRPCELKHAGGVINGSARRGINSSAFDELLSRP
jgi:hypothetical protein